jgi:hypothetical protein
VVGRSGHVTEWSVGWEKVYATLGLDARDSVPYRRLRVKAAYEQYLLRLELLVNRYISPAPTSATTLSRVRCSRVPRVCPAQCIGGFVFTEAQGETVLPGSATTGC